MKEKMEKIEKAEVIVSLIVGILDICGNIFANIKNYIWLNILTYIIFILICLYWYKKYKQRKDFMDFIYYLFFNEKHRFNVLPKVCLRMEEERKFNNLLLENMTIEYSYDMSESDFTQFPKKPIEYKSEIKYWLDIKNEKLPKKFGFYFGNMTGDTLKNFQQITKEGKAGEKLEEKYELIPFDKKLEGKLDTNYYIWELKETEKPENLSVYKMGFQLDYEEKTKAYSDTIIFYPKQFAENIDNLKVKFNLKSNKVKLESFECYKISKGENNVYETTGMTAKINDCEAQVETKIGDTTYIAYYFVVRWKVI